jgi:hypothetical protein
MFWGAAPLPCAKNKLIVGLLFLPHYLISNLGLIAILVRFYERDLFAFIFGGLLALFAALS